MAKGLELSLELHNAEQRYLAMQNMLYAQSAQSTQNAQAQFGAMQQAAISGYADQARFEMDMREKAEHARVNASIRAEVERTRSEALLLIEGEA